jgi:hypothetical protein
MRFNKKKNSLFKSDYFLLTKEDKVNNYVLGAELGKIFLLEISLGIKSSCFFDDESEEAILYKVDIKPFKRRKE